MKFPFSLMVATLLVAAISCDRDAGIEQENLDRIAIENTYITLYEGENASVDLSYSKFDRGIYVEQEYDFNTNPHHIRFESSDETVATVEITENGAVVTGVGAGTADITVKTDNGLSAKKEVTVTAE